MTSTFMELGVRNNKKYMYECLPTVFTVINKCPQSAVEGVVRVVLSLNQFRATYEISV